MSKPLKPPKLTVQQAVEIMHMHESPAYKKREAAFYRLCNQVRATREKWINSPERVKYGSRYE